TFSLTTHFETDKSVAVKGRFKVPQKVTILKMGGEDLTQRWVAKGKIVENPSNQMACRTQIKILVLDKPVNYFLENSIANHHCVVLGDYVEEIQEFFRFTLEF
ncbi:MAG: fucose isomerase, partial [Candidatus Hodarchaeota archaeon]